MLWGNGEVIHFLLSQLQGDGLRSRAIRGAAFTFLQFGGHNILRLVSNLILTRLLYPEAFGLMALVMVAVTGLQMFSDLGFRTAIIQDRRGDDPIFLNTAWTMQVARGGLLWLAACGFAVPVANFYEEPMLAALLPIVALNALIAGFNSTAMATVNRQLMLGRLTAMSLGCQAVSILVMIGLAYVLRSVWALVIGQLIGSLLLAALSHLVLPGIRNRFQFEREAFWSLFNFGKYIFVGTIATFLITQGDRAVLGKFVPLEDLAFYNIAYFLASVPLLLARTMADRVIFPLYTNRHPSESSDNRQKIAKARLLVTAVMFMISVVLCIGGDWIIRFLYDARYHSAGPLLVLLSIGLLPSLIINSYGGLFLAAGHSRRFAVFVTTSAFLRFSLLLYAAPRFGVVGVALVPLVSEVLIYPLLLAMLRPYRGWDLRHDAIFLALAVVLAAAAIWANSTALEELFAVAGLSV